MPNKLIISDTVENLSMATTKKAEFTCELPAPSQKELQKMLSAIEKEIKKIGGDDIVATFSVDGLTETGYKVTLHIETVALDINTLRKDIWMLLGEKTRGV